MTQVPASSHGGGSFPPAHWTVATDGELAIAPPTTAGFGPPIAELITADLAADTVDVFRITSTPEVAPLFNVDSGGSVEQRIVEPGNIGYNISETHPGTGELLRIAGMDARTGRFIATLGGAVNGQFQIGKGGCLVHGLNAAPADADLSAGSFGLWLDSTNGAAKLMVKAKQANGTVVTAAVALA